MWRDSSVRLAEAPADAARRRLVLLLRSSIERGDYPSGRLPAEARLMQLTGETRAVVRDALNELAEMRLVQRSPGLGTTTDVLPSIFSLREFHGVDGVPRQSVYPVETDRTVIPTPPAVARRLPGCGPEVLRVEHLSVALSFPGAVTTDYFRFPDAAALVDAEFGHNVYAYMANAGLSVKSSELVFGATAADEYAARVLQMPPGAPLLTIDETMFDADDRAICFATIWQRADRVRYFGRRGVPAPSGGHARGAEPDLDDGTWLRGDEEGHRPRRS
ncbi:GntR family transcriptional regulator [Microbacterium saperdae]